MMSEMSGSPSSSSSGPKPSSSSISTFSSANCSRRLSVTLSSASTSRMIGRNSSDSSSLVSVAAASGSTRSSRRGSTCSLILWTEASKPCASAGICGWRWRGRRAATSRRSSFRRRRSGVRPGSRWGSGGNWSPPGSGAWPPPPGGVEASGVTDFIGRATPKAGRAPGAMPLLPCVGQMRSYPVRSCAAGTLASGPARYS